MAKIAPFLIASLSNLLPSYFLPLTPTNIVLFFIFLEFIDARFIFFLILTILGFNVSFIMFVLIDFDRFFYFFRILISKFLVYLKKVYLFLYS